jgi:hypothetical protein
MAGERRKMGDWVDFLWRVMKTKFIMLMRQLGLNNSFIAAGVASKGV